MESMLEQQLYELRRKRYRHRIGLAILVALLTVYALILPAITLEQHGCELEEHSHGRECYAQVFETVRLLRECSPHQHEETCYDSEGELICGYADFYVHSHSDACYDPEGELICTLPEIEAHSHEDACYAPPASAAEPETAALDGEAAAEDPAAAEHKHDDSCYGQVRAELLCQLPEEGHSHDASCYSQEETLICLLSEGEIHLHGEDCFDEAGQLLCPLTEGEPHFHGEDCYHLGSTLSCGQEEREAHSHEDACYALQDVLICGYTESGIVEDGSGEENIEEENIEEENIEENEENAADAMPLSTEAELICGKEEIILHEHDADCLDEDGNLICGKLQILEHVHSEECFYEEEMPLDADVLYCGIELSEEHEHDAFCYGCWKLICPLEEHQHSEECEAPGALSEEEEAEIEALIERIAALPDREDFEARLLAEKEAENWTAYRDYWVETRRQVQEAFAAYDLLDENQKSLVSNIFILEDLEYLLSAEEFPAELPEELQSSTEEAAAGGMLLGSVAPWEISLSIPLQVFCENAKNNTEFNLSLLEVTAYEAGNWSFGETLQSLRCVARSGKPAEEEFRLSYPVGSSGSFYYGLRLEGDEPYVQYDDTYYVLQVLLEQDAESVENRARLAKAWRNGSEELAVPEEEIRFENQKTSSLTVTLSLNGFSGETEPFAFVAELSEASSGLSLGSTAAEVSQSLEGTEITFELRDGESICIENIPAGSDIRVQEILKAGFTAYHKLGEGGRLQAGESVVITDLAEAQNITLYFVNSSGYVLPQTGGHGTMVYRLGGLLAILLSGTILLLFNIARRKEGRDAL